MDQTYAPLGQLISHTDEAYDRLIGAIHAGVDAVCKDEAQRKHQNNYKALRAFLSKSKLVLDKLDQDRYEAAIAKWSPPAGIAPPDRFVEIQDMDFDGWMKDLQYTARTDGQPGLWITFEPFSAALGRFYIESQIGRAHV